MKKQIVLMLAASALFFANAQTGPQLIGMTSYGGLHNSGTILRYTGGNTTVFATSFGPSSRNSGPASSTFAEARNGKLYALNGYGDSTVFGNLFEFDYLHNNIRVIEHFGYGSSGEPANGALLQADNGLLYGMITTFGFNNDGALFSFNTDSSLITPTGLFTGVGAPIAYGDLIQSSDGKLYGMSLFGSLGNGSIFAYDIATATDTQLYYLPLNAFPHGDLIEVGTDTLYGLTFSDGTDSGGTIFRYIINTGSYSVLHNLNSGATPQGSMIQATDGKLYGMTYLDGANLLGTIFSFDIATGTYTDLHDFGVGADGQRPYGSLFQASDGILYGMTTYGGTSNLGTIFQYDISNASYSKKVDLNSSTGDFPLFGHFIEYLPAGINTQPVNAIVCPGDIVLFQSSDNAISATVQWQVSIDSGSTFTNIPFATDTIYHLLAISSKNAYQYRAIFINSFSQDTSLAVTLSVWPVESITQFVSVCQGQSVTVGTMQHSAQGNYNDTLIGASVHGCDSIVLTHLSVVDINDSILANGSLCIARQDSASYQWIDCDTHLVITGATSQTFQAMQNGSFQCVVSRAGCTDTTTCIQVTAVGIEKAEDFNFSLYPNPVGSKFKISHNYPGVLSVQVFNLMGEKIKEFNSANSIDGFEIDEFPQGVYFVLISGNRQLLSVFKVVKD